MEFIHKISGAILTWAMNNKYILMTLNVLLPVAVYFEAGPVSAFITYFGFYLVISMAMAVARDDQMKEEMQEALRPHMEEILKDIRDMDKKSNEKEKDNQTKH